MLLQEGAHQPLKGTGREPLKGGNRPAKGTGHERIKEGDRPLKGSGREPLKNGTNHPIKGGPGYWAKGNSVALARETCNERIGTGREPIKGGNRPLKGSGRQPLKNGTDRPIKGGTGNPRKGDSAALARETCNERIGELEADFKALTEFTKTNWNRFITRGWSVILAKELPQELGVRYSAKQCALNLLALHEETSTT
jgi:hypothetical protein